MEVNIDVFTKGKKYNIVGTGPGTYEGKVPSGYKFKLPGGAMHIEPNKDNIREISPGVNTPASGRFASEATKPAAGTGTGGRKTRRRKSRKGKSKRRSTGRR